MDANENMDGTGDTSQTDPAQGQDNANLDPDDAHYDAEFTQMLERVAQEAAAQPAPAPSAGASFVDESANFWVGHEFTVDQFAAWWKVQNLGHQPFNAVGYHHTFSPTPNIWAGMPSFKAVYDFYHDKRGWRPWGMGPHLFLYAGNSHFSSGTPRIYVGVHPRHDGAGILGRNGRWLHIEHIHNGDVAPFPDALKKLSGQVLAIVCAPQATANRQIPLKFIQVGSDNPSQPLGIMYHRDVNLQNPPKSCPGQQVSHANLDADVFEFAQQYLHHGA